MKSLHSFLPLRFVLLFGLAAASHAQAQTAPIASWSFDKQENNTYRGVGKGTFTYAGAVVGAGVISGKVTSVADGKKGGAASFTEQSPGFIHVPIDLSLLKKGFTVEFWLRPAGETTLYGTCIDAGSSQGFVIRLNSTERLSLSLGGKWNVVVNTERLVDPVWTHVALTFDGTVTRLYVAGVEVGNAPGMDVTKINSGFYLGAVDERVKLPDGSSNLTTVKPLFGDLDELQIYAQALKPAEIAKAAGVKPAR